jgi:hypothetical protein
MSTTDDEREALARDIRAVDGAHDLGAAGLAEALTELGWTRRHGSIADAQVEAGARGILAAMGIKPEEDGTYWGEAAWTNALQDARAALEAARDAS